MLVFKCDRCGQEFEPGNPRYGVTRVELEVKNSGTIGISYSEQSYEDTELCKSCKDQLIEFLKGRALEEIKD